MEIKKRKILFVSILLLLGGLLVSCSKVNDMRLDTLKKSIEKLEQNYKDYSPEKLMREIEQCEIQFEKLDQDKDKLSINQKQQLSNLDSKFNKVLIKIGWDIYRNGLSDEYRKVIEYIKDLLKKRWSFTDDLSSLETSC